jgi:hypothetical protein
MGLSIRPQHLNRYREVALLLIKIGRTDIVDTAGLSDLLDDTAAGTDAKSLP